MDDPLFGFEWDSEKARRNRLKHGVSFREAISIFADPWRFTRHDVSHSLDEDRDASIGVTTGGRLVIVFYTYRRDRIRLISARPATWRERRDYEEAKD